MKIIIFCHAQIQVMRSGKNRWYGVDESVRNTMIAILDKFMPGDVHLVCMSVKQYPKGGLHL